MSQRILGRSPGRPAEVHQDALRSATVERAVGELQSLGITDTKFDGEVRLSRTFLRLSHHVLAGVDAHDTSDRANPPGKGPHVVTRPAAYVQQVVAFSNLKQIVGPLLNALDRFQLAHGVEVTNKLVRVDCTIDHTPLDCPYSPLS
jgi:hypothetical protein